MDDNAAEGSSGSQDGSDLAFAVPVSRQRFVLYKWRKT